MNKVAIVTLFAILTASLAVGGYIGTHQIETIVMKNTELTTVGEAIVEGNSENENIINMTIEESKIQDFKITGGKLKDTITLNNTINEYGIIKTFEGNDEITISGGKAVIHGGMGSDNYIINTENMPNKESITIYDDGGKMDIIQTDFKKSSSFFNRFKNDLYVFNEQEKKIIIKDFFVDDSKAVEVIIMEDTPFLKATFKKMFSEKTSNNDNMKNKIIATIVLLLMGVVFLIAWRSEKAS